MKNEIFDETGTFKKYNWDKAYKVYQRCLWCGHWTSAQFCRRSCLNKYKSRFKRFGSNHFIFPLGEKVEDVIKEYIKQSVKMLDGNKKLTAETLGIARRTIYNKL